MEKAFLGAFVAAAVLLVAAVVWGLTGPHGAVGSDDQCSKPVSQRTGGWVCPGDPPPSAAPSIPATPVAT